MRDVEIFYQFLLDFFSLLGALVQGLGALLALLAGELELTGHLDMNLVEGAIGILASIHHVRHLVEDFLNHRVAQRVFGQHLKMLQQLLSSNLLTRERRLGMPVACGRASLAVHHALLHVGQNLLDSLGAKRPVIVVKFHLSHSLGIVGRQRCQRANVGDKLVDARVGVVAFIGIKQMPQPECLALLVTAVTEKIGIELERFENRLYKCDFLAGRQLVKFFHVVACPFHDTLILLEKSSIGCVAWHLVAVDAIIFSLQCKHLKHPSSLHVTLNVEFVMQPFLLLHGERHFGTVDFRLHPQVIYHLPHFKFLIQRHAARTHLGACHHFFLLAIDLHSDFFPFKLTIGNEPLLRLEFTLIENHGISYFFFKLSSELRMKSTLSLPYLFKLIQVILTIEHAILYAEMRILLKTAHQVLPHRHVTEVELLAVVADVAQVTACSCNCAVQAGKHCNYLL